MSKTRVLTSTLCAVVFLTLASSARADTVLRADVVQADMLLEKLIFAERHNLTVFDFQRAETGYLYQGHFENNNGKHLGFSVAVFKQGPQLGIVRESPPAGANVTQNPEPTAMVLLGTGLAAVAAFARKKSRKRSI